MTAHSSVLAWSIPGAGELVGCRLWGRTESDTREMTPQQQHTPAWRALTFLLSQSMHSVCLFIYLELCFLSPVFVEFFT